MDIFNIEPRPLVFTNKNLVVAWSPKSACSHVVVWFLIKHNLLAAANYFHSWPHEYRARVLYQSQGHQNRVKAVHGNDGKGFTLLKITRDPAKRLISIFRHVCRHTFMHELIEDKLGFSAAKEGFSLQDFRALLEGENLTVLGDLNHHLCLQWHPSWDLNYDRVVTLNMDTDPLNDGLNQVEDDFGLQKTAFDQFPKFQILRDLHYATDSAFEHDGAIETFRFKPSDTKTFPKKDLLNSAFLQQMAQDFYAQDFNMVNSGDTDGKLFCPSST